MNNHRIGAMVFCIVAMSAFCACTPEAMNQILGQLGAVIGNASGNPSGNTNTNTNTNGGTSNNPPSSQGSPANVPDQRFPAVLSGAGPEHGDAEYREVGTRRKLKVELEDAVVGSTHAIVVDGVSVGDLVIGPLGEGEVEFDTKIEPGHVPWPADLPLRLSPGVIIQVGNTSGVLAG
jgi:hypothetical protein